MSEPVIKKIDISQLKLGMYIHDLNCGWMENPFFRKQFKLSSQKEIDSIQEAGIRNVYIDVSKGLDAKQAPTREEVRNNLEDAIIQLATKPPEAAIRTSLHDELAHARHVKDQAQKQVVKMMQDVRLGKAIKLDEVEPVVEGITSSILSNSSALTSLLRIKTGDDYTFLHSVSVCALMITFCRSAGMNKETIRQAGIGGLLHDMGKSMIPDNILNKPDKLTDKEFDIMRQHPQIGYNLMERMPGIGPIPLDIALHHHERMDGNGYPEKLKSREISQLSQMAAIVDVYDAITSDRCYHKGMTAAQALRRLFEWSDFHFDPQMIHAFIRCVGIYPVGTLVMMESGHLAVVSEPNDADLLAPCVTLFFNTKSNVYITPQTIDLSKPLGAGGGDRIIGHELPEKWNVDPMRALNLV